MYECAYGRGEGVIVSVSVNGRLIHSLAFIHGRISA